ncbi:hypothetical protein NL500_29255, partial [Klebsiella pneumoniae]|nr:hypothetical protein [Klebsiella pneumoniae]
NPKITSTVKIFAGEKVSIINAIVLARGINNIIRAMIKAAAITKICFAVNILVNNAISKPMTILPNIMPT